MSDSKESFEILENGSGDGVAASSSQIGDASGGKIGMTVFPFRDASGVLRMPEVNASNVLKTDGSSVTQPISAASLPLPTGAATETTLSAINTKIPASPSEEHVTAGSPHSVRLTDGTSFYKATTPADTQPVSGPLTDAQLRATSVPVTANAGTNLNTSLLSLETTQVTVSTRIGDLTETAPGTDTASSGLNGRLQRIAQRITSLLTATTDGTQRTKITNGTVDATLSTGVIGLSDTGIAVRPIPFEPLSYSATGSAFVPAATATDIYLISGSNTKTIRIHKVSVSGTTTSGSAIKCTIKLIKRSTANTGGTSVTSTIVSHDSNNATATAVAKHYTANPTVGTDAGTIRSITNSFQSSGITKGSIDFDFVNDGGQPVILRGTGQNLAVNLNSTTITGGVISVSIEWSEV
jgi:hypothetical protein